MKYKNDLIDRLLQFSADVIKTSRALPKNPEFDIIKRQLIKSVTSVGANYQESQSASSPADFKNKVRIALKEMSESTYWIRLIILILENTNLQMKLKRIQKESKELEKILGSIIHKSRIKS